MTHTEFEDRTGVIVSQQEFLTINEMYLTCECGKDTFCRYWMKMNPQRVADAKMNNDAAKALTEARNFAWGITNVGYTYDERMNPECNPLTWKEVMKYNQYARHYGFKTTDELEREYRDVRLVDMLNELNRFQFGE